ncbi:hypothetical protein VaNZ11_004749 [Volvox africanus]|uniref:Uncharacterized protein n=1 Tax=Volvox africanus TaxID=51714 RepID=A0ABQ5RXM8_9CHLO|nr:hypothetical protein VaNZ11_004749 [Volvox africanus]
MSEEADWTPFCVPWTWTRERCLYWRCPQPILITCVIDGVQDTDPSIACVIHRDKQLGFRAIPNDMSRACKFIGLHLVDIARRDLANSSTITFYLTRGSCPCERQLPPPAQQPQQRQQFLKGKPNMALGAQGQHARRQVLSTGQSEGTSTNEDDGAAAEAAATAARRDFMSGGGARGNGHGAVQAIGLGGSSGSGAAGITGAGLGLPGSVVAQPGRCRCPCHARHLTQVLVSSEEGEEMEERGEERPFSKQKGACGSAGIDRDGGRAASGGPTAEAALAVDRRNAAGAARLAALRPLPRMSAAPREAVASNRSSKQRSRVPLMRLAASYLPSHVTAAAAGGPRATTIPPTTATAAGATGTAAAAAAAGVAPALERLYISQRSYRYMGPANCTVLARPHHSTVAAFVIEKYFPKHKRVLVTVEIDGVLQPAHEQYASCRVTSFMSYSTRIYRIFPTPPLAVGKLCVGWGLMPDDNVLIMQVVSDSKSYGGIEEGLVRPQHPRGDNGAHGGGGSGQAEKRKRTVADAGLEERRLTRTASIGGILGSGEEMTRGSASMAASSSDMEDDEEHGEGETERFDEGECEGEEGEGWRSH